MANTKKEKFVLLIEDDGVLTDMYVTKFQTDGIGYLCAADGQAGLDLAKTKKPALILLDIMMPKLDGFAVLTQLKKDLKTKNIPVVILSNLGQESDIKKGMELGAVDYVVKASFTPAQVVEKIIKYFG